MDKEILDVEGDEDFWAKAEPHSVHAYGFSPVCIRMWMVRFDIMVNFDPHSGQTQDFRGFRTFLRPTE